ncbi:MAG: hypothetical protein IJT76_09105 [Clostridia bacterium]|nr:hypothetical protein [Clostridia bacterium]
MNCPYCKKEMRPGWIQSRDALGWSEKKRAVPALAGLLAEVELLSATKAFYCPDCRKIVIDRDDMK